MPSLPASMRRGAEAEERGQAALVLGYVADGVFLVDANGTVQLWNPAAEAITGISAEAVLGLPVEKASRLGFAREGRHHCERPGCVHCSCGNASCPDRNGTSGSRSPE